MAVVGRFAFPCAALMLALLLGAGGALAAEEKAPEGKTPQNASEAPEVSNEFPAVTATAYKRGYKLFRKKTCNGCHAFGEFFDKCPDLAGVTGRRSAAWIRHWLKDPDLWRRRDETAKKLSEEYKEVMPFLDLQDDEIEDLLVYLLQEGKAPDEGAKK